jgi:O-antigen ligase
MCTAVFVAGVGLLKRFGLNPFPWWEYPELPQNVHRVTGTYGNANHLAGYMEMSIPLLVGLLLTDLSKSRRLLVVFGTSLMVLSLIFSLSRGGWLGAFVSMALMGGALLVIHRFERKQLTLGLIGAVLLLSFVVLASTSVVERIVTLERGESIPNLRSRMIIWSGTENIIRDYPLLGTGPGTFAVIFTQYQPSGFAARYFNGHNDYLHFTSEIGLCLLPVIAWMIIVLYQAGFKKLQTRSRLARATTIGGLCGLTAILIHSISDFNLHVPANVILFVVLAALVVGFEPAFEQRLVKEYR